MFDFCKATNKISEVEADGLINKRQLLIDKQNSKRHCRRHSRSVSIYVPEVFLKK